jgi:methionyl-tRNA synthetase
MQEENKNEEVLEVKKSKGISIDDFKKIDIVVGQIVAVEKVSDTDKLLKLTVDMGEPAPRTIVSGIALYFEDFNILVGKKCIFVANLEPRTLRGIESQGMILAVSTEGGKFSLLEPNSDIPPGTHAK